MTTQRFESSHTQRPLRVVGTGLVALDVLVCEETPKNPPSLGGSAGNVLAILAYLGWSAVPVAKLGKDLAALQISSEFESLNADTRFILQDETSPTPIVYQWPGDSVTTHRFSFHCPSCGTKRGFVPADGDATFCVSVLENIKTTDVFYFDRVTPWALTLAEAYRSRNALVVFEPSTICVDREAFQKAIDTCNVLKYADDRIRELETFDRNLVDVEIRTEGAKGLRFTLASENKSLWHSLRALYVPEISDTAGAGDWCTSGFLHYLKTKKTGLQEASSLELANALRFGQILAALNCMQPGARGLAKQFNDSFLKEKISSLLHSDLLNSGFEPIWKSISKDFCSNITVKHHHSLDYAINNVHAIDELCCKPAEF